MGNSIRVKNIRKKVRKILDEIFKDSFLPENFGKEACDDITESLVCDNTPDFTAKNVTRRLVEETIFLGYLCRVQ